MQKVFSVLLLLGSYVASATKSENQDVNDEIRILKDMLRKQSNEFDAEIKSLKAEIKELKQEMAQCHTNINTNANHNEERIKRLLSGATANVAFYAHLSTHIYHLGNYQTIVFDVVRTNQGNSYNRLDGEFTAPFGGSYFFIWTTSNMDNTYMQTELIVNGVVFGQIISDAAEHTDWAVATGFTIVQLSTGDRVWIRSGATNSGHISGVGYGTSSFAGFHLW